MQIPNAQRVEWLHKLIALRDEAWDAGIIETDLDRLWSMSRDLWLHVPGSRLVAPEPAPSVSPGPDQAPLPAGSTTGVARPESL